MSSHVCGIRIATKRHHTTSHVVCRLWKSESVTFVISASREHREHAVVAAGPTTDSDQRPTSTSDSSRPVRLSSTCTTHHAGTVVRSHWLIQRNPSCSNNTRTASSGRTVSEVRRCGGAEVRFVCVHFGAVVLRVSVYSVCRLSVEFVTPYSPVCPSVACFRPTITECGLLLSNCCV